MEGKQARAKEVACTGPVEAKGRILISRDHRKGYIE